LEQNNLAIILRYYYYYRYPLPQSFSTISAGMFRSVRRQWERAAN